MILLWFVILAGYAICAVQSIIGLSSKRASMNRLALASLSIAFTAHTVWLLNEGIKSGRCPLVDAQEKSAFLSWCLVLAYLLAQRWYHAGALRAFVFPIVFVLASIAAILPGTTEHPEGIANPVQKVLLAVHAGLIMLSYAAFFIAFGAGLMFIIQERELKLKRFGSIFFRLPSLDTCDAISFKSMSAGFTLLTMGMAAGIIWSRVRDGIFWHGQPIEVFSVFTWVVYLLIIQSRINAGWGGRKAAVASIAGFVLVIVSLAGVRYLGALHVFG